MNDEILTTGRIMKNRESGERWRLIAITGGTVVMCRMDIAYLKLQDYDVSTILVLADSGELAEEKEETKIFDKDRLSPNAREEYERRLRMMQEVVNAYGPLFLGLSGKHDKPELKEILSRYPYSLKTFQRLCVRYFQSGMKNISLVDERSLRGTQHKEYDYKQKPGRKPAYLQQGILVDDEVKKIFDEGVKYIESGRKRTFRAAFDFITALHYSEPAIVGGEASVKIMGEGSRPTMRQFRYYAGKRLDPVKLDAVKTSKQEQRNNKRLLTSDALYGVAGPGDMVEIDACEADVSLVSEIDPDQSIGRPVVYFMIDVYTRIILAMYISLDNNSFLGVTNLFLNLADDKKEYCARYGMTLTDPDLWPSGILPRRIRVDRGSEFKGKDFERLCVELCIERELVTGGSGSLKGTVEQAFHQMHEKQNPSLENYGLIQKRYDSQHHRESTLNMKQYTQMVINFVLTHNQTYLPDYQLTKDMLENRIKPVPALLWKYGVEKYTQPRPVPQKEQYLYELMVPVKCKITRKGILWNGLWYFAEEDIELQKQMFMAGNKKIPFDVRIDPRCVGAVYYVRDGKLVTAPLNERLTGNGEYKDKTAAEWEEYRRRKKEMDAAGRAYNEKLSAYSRAADENIVKNAAKENYSKTKNMREARKNEKQMLSAENKIQGRLEDAEPASSAVPEPVPADEGAQQEDGFDFSGFDAALLDFAQRH